MDSPLVFEKWRSYIKASAARRSKERIGVRVASFDLAGDRSYCLEVDRQRAEVIVRSNRIGEHRFPPEPKVLDLERLGQGPARMRDFDGYRPGHRALHPLPERLPAELVRPPGWRRGIGVRDDAGEPTTVFAPDTRLNLPTRRFPGVPAVAWIRPEAGAPES